MSAAQKHELDLLEIRLRVQGLSPQQYARLRELRRLAGIAE